MAIYMAAILLLGDEEDDAFEPHNQVMIVTRRILRDVSDPFSVRDNKFFKPYRHISRSTAIPHKLQVQYIPIKSFVKVKKCKYMKKSKTKKTSRK